MMLSGCVMTKDSLETLPACLDSLEPFCDEVLVVDDHSSDGTWEYLQKRSGTGKVRPVQRALDTFPSHRRWMCAQARGAWLLILDADEAAMPGFGEEVRRVIASSPRCDAFRVPMKNMLPAHWPSGGHFTTSQKRLLRAGRVRWEQSSWVHAPVLHEGPTGRLEKGLVHHGFDSMTHLLKKQLSYAQSSAQHWHAKGRQSGLTATVLKSLAAFLKFYVVLGLCRFGMDGFMASAALSFHELAKFGLLWERSLGAPPSERRRVPA